MVPDSSLITVVVGDPDRDAEKLRQMLKDICRKVGESVQIICFEDCSWSILIGIV